MIAVSTIGNLDELRRAEVRQMHDRPRRLPDR